MRTVKTKEVKPQDFNNEKRGVVNEFTLKEAFVLWINHSKKDGKPYLSGYTSTKDETEEITSLVGYYNTNKSNPKQPDIRVYALVDGKQDIEVAALWETTSKVKGTRYLTGSTNDNEKLIGFYAKESVNGRPDIRVYYKEN